MNIGINLLAVRPGISGGIEFYIQNLLEELSIIDLTNRYILFTNRENHSIMDFKKENFHRVPCNINPHLKMLRITWEQILLPRLARRYHLDLLHSPTYTLPILTQIPGVVSILDMLYRVYPDTIPMPKLIFWRLFIPLSTKKCRKVLTISESSKKDIVNFLAIPESKVVVTPLALDRKLDIGKQPTEEEIEVVCAKYGIRRPYLLNVGGIGKHKNPFSLIRAFEILHRKFSMMDLSLMITGNDYGVREELTSFLAISSVRGAVVLPGYVERGDLPALYAGAFAYVAPSFFEGFGLTVLEAMAFYTPVVASNRASLPEVAGNAAILVNPDSPEDIAGAVARLASDPSFRSEMVRRGRDWISEFSWERTARLTLNAYREAVGLE